jgi:phage gpG-like protein
MLIITVEDSAFRAKLEKLQASLGNLTPVMSEIGQQLESNVRQRFETRTDPSGALMLPPDSPSPSYRLSLR